MTPKDRREAILEATLQVLVRKGMAATTVRDVAQEMGTSSGLIHHYYASMDELLAEAFERSAGQDLEATRDSMAEGADPVAAMRIFFDTYVRADEAWAFQLWLDAWSEAPRRPALQETSRRLNVAWQELLEDAIRSGVAAGLMTCPDPKGAAWRILSLLDGLALQNVAHRIEFEQDAVITWSASYAETELGLAAGSLTPVPADSAG
jgi:AcrR family transcriptional regulator